MFIEEVKDSIDVVKSRRGRYDILRQEVIKMPMNKVIKVTLDSPVKFGLIGAARLKNDAYRVDAKRQDDESFIWLIGKSTKRS
jgi:hypothetical protein